MFDVLVRALETTSVLLGDAVKRFALQVGVGLELGGETGRSLLASGHLEVGSLLVELLGDHALVQTVLSQHIIQFILVLVVVL